MPSFFLALLTLFLVIAPWQTAGTIVYAGKSGIAAVGINGSTLQGSLSYKLAAPRTPWRPTPAKLNNFAASAIAAKHSAYNKVIAAGSSVQAPISPPYVSLETLQSCIVSLSWVFLISALWWRWTLLPQAQITDQQSASTAEERCCLLDNAKIVVQFFVIYGHFIFDGRSESGPFNNLPSHTSTWFSGIGNLGWQFLDGTAPYRMPLACFISGICSQGPWTKKRGLRFIKNLLAPTLLWVFFAKPVLHASLMTLSPWIFWERLQELTRFHAVEAEWYLTSLVCWRGSAFLVWSQLHPQVALAGMLLISCVAGYHNFHEGAPYFLWLDATFGFMPYFALGYVFPFREVCRLIPELESKQHRTLVAVGVFLWSCFLVPYMFPEGLPACHGMYTGGVYNSLSPWDQKLFWSRRLARIALEMVPALSLLFLVIPRWETYFTWVGSHTLYPFLFHNVALSWEDKFLGVFPPPVVNLWHGHIIVLLLHAPFVFLIIVGFASSHWRRLFSWCLEPDWVGILLSDNDDTPEQRVATKMQATNGTATVTSGAPVEKESAMATP